MSQQKVQIVENSKCYSPIFSLDYGMYPVLRRNMREVKSIQFLHMLNYLSQDCSVDPLGIVSLIYDYVKIPSH